jgi:HAD superfamily hydrolase (TIGR01549 family)
MIQEELYDVVNRHGKKIGMATWTEVHRKGLLHQNVHGIVFEDESRKRTLIKKRNPKMPQESGSIEIAVAGHMLSGSSPEDAIRKEISEELLGGKKLDGTIKIKKMGRYFNNDLPNNHEIAYVFEIIYKGPFYKSDESEGDSYWTEWVDLTSDIKKTPSKYAQYSINAIQWYNKMRKKMSPNVSNSKLLNGSSIVFDWGNTLVFDPFDDISPAVSKLASKAARETFGFKLDADRFHKEWSKANAEMMIPFSSHFSQEEPFIQAGLKASNVPAEIRALLAPRILNEYRLSFKELLQRDPRKKEIRDTLESLKERGKHLAVISNDRSFTPQSTLTWLGVADLFDHFLTSEEMGVEKPDPRVFEIASRHFGKPVEDIVYVGDDPKRDIECAHQAGAKAILYVPPEKYRTAKAWRDYSLVTDTPDAKVEGFEELLGVIS